MADLTSYLGLLYEAGCESNCSNTCLQKSKASLMVEAIAHTRIQTSVLAGVALMSLQELKEQAYKLSVSDRHNEVRSLFI